jgi:hypothetical protein
MALPLKENGLTGIEKMNAISPLYPSTIVKGHDHHYLCSMELKAL